MKKTFWAVLAALVISAGGANGQEWGGFEGTFQFDGTPPVAAKITPTKDAQFCGKGELKDEKIVVNPENKGLANVVIYLNPARGTKVAVHPDYEKTAKDKVTLNNQGCAFVPHITLLRTSQTLVVGNPDEVPHNAKIECVVNNGRNPIVPAKQSVEETFKKEERLPVTVSCAIHTWMSGRILIKDHPYMAVSDADGKFKIENLPAGKWEFQIWHESPGYLQEVSVDGKKTKWNRGRVEVEIKAGETANLGTVLVPAASFK